MIPATQSYVKPATQAVTYGHWTLVGLSGSRVGEGVFAVGIRLHRSRLLGDANTELSPDPAHAIELAVPNIYAPAGTHGDWWTADVRTAVVNAAAGLVGAVAQLGAAKGVL